MSGVVIFPGQSQAHASASRTLGYALLFGGYEDWKAAAQIFALRLTARERAALAWSALRSLDPDHAQLVAQAILGPTGMPLYCETDPMGMASMWSDWASAAERRAYALACYRRMSPQEQVAFVDIISGRAA